MPLSQIDETDFGFQAVVETGQVPSAADDAGIGHHDGNGIPGVGAPTARTVLSLPTAAAMDLWETTSP